LSDHFDASDGRTDITDLYIFPASDPARAVVVLDVNPEPSDLPASIDPTASYEIKIDTDGDRYPDLAFHVVFDSNGREWRPSVYRADGAAARDAGVVGDVVIGSAPLAADGQSWAADSEGYRFFMGIRSDPHFKDIQGFRNGFQFTGDDPVALRNVVGIVLEVPEEACTGSAGPVRVWARTLALDGGKLTQVDQAGRPGINNAFNTEEDDNAAFCRSSPEDQEAAFGDKFVAFLSSIGYPDNEAREVARGFLPDWLVYDSSKPIGYPNGAD
jgi:hypothetical protein